MIIKEEEQLHTLGGRGSWDVFWYPWDGGIITRRRPPTFIDFTAVSIPDITCNKYIDKDVELIATIYFCI